ncbi:sporulation phosphorelay system protein KapB [Pullulanibacillus sp. KACC 23026]|uniref:sporulation phosphorelay system protein KapB n=1 Tax=Pullulanibacillus sp. KACC 23026 TaxID=3028315 RepID=UPI0023B1C89B|nr:sporulation phosphorelay system protein KapB [Pullulanibacillus sp. KACC 23026]WEG10862.1 sporulation phosphorelay system protein KapB [Pullulanibacillus sp. KACC 23026]
MSFEKGDLVIATYKTGEYVCRYIEDRHERNAVVEVLAVRRHPTQGDLHNPNQVEVALFHQRKALAFHEKAVVHQSGLVPFEGEVPDYQESLREALHEKLTKLETRNDEWAARSIQELKELEKDYFKQ